MLTKIENTSLLYLYLQTIQIPIICPKESDQGSQSPSSHNFLPEEVLKHDSLIEERLQSSFVLSNLYF